METQQRSSLLTPQGGLTANYNCCVNRQRQGMIKKERP